jgi:hypothetical protein
MLIARFLYETNRSVYVCVPSLFQNKGIISTWEGKVGLSRSPTFQERAMHRVAHDLGDLLDIVRYRRRATWDVLRYRVRKPRWLQRIVDQTFDVVLSLRRRLFR